MANQLLMPKATAIWLIDNTSLSFDQIAAFCHLHPLEIQAIANGDAAHGMRGLDPIMTGQIARDEIEKGEKDPTYCLQMKAPKVQMAPPKRKGARYTPLSKRQDRPNAILWLLRHHPELKDAQISRLVGTTKATIEQIRNRTHWNSANLVAMDPVALGLCSQIDLDREVKTANKNRPPMPESDETLLPASATEQLEPENFSTDYNREPNIHDVFSRFKKSTSSNDKEEE